MVRAKKTIASVLCNTGIRVTAAWLGCFLPPLILCEASGLDFPKQLTAAALVVCLVIVLMLDLTKGRALRIFIRLSPLLFTAVICLVLRESWLAGMRGFLTELYDRMNRYFGWSLEISGEASAEEASLALFWMPCVALLMELSMLAAEGLAPIAWINLSVVFPAICVATNIFPGAGYLCAYVCLCLYFVMAKDSFTLPLRSGTRLRLLFAGVLAALGLAACLLISRDVYEKRLVNHPVRITLREKIWEVMPSLFGKAKNTQNYRGGMSGGVIPRSGSVRDNKSTVMKVTLPKEAGEVHLRGAAYGDYDGTNWKAANKHPFLLEDIIHNYATTPITQIPVRDLAAFLYQTAQNNENSDRGRFTILQSTMKIELQEDLGPYLFVPYDTAGAVDANSGKRFSTYNAEGILMPGDEGAAEYECDYYYNTYQLPGYMAYQYDVSHTPRRGSSAYDLMLKKYEDYVYASYLDIPKRCEGVYDLAPLPEGAPLFDAIDAVRNMLSDNYRYTKSPKAVPEDSDFIMYFLTESKEGYCMHYASAAVMLFRAMGIPARFVEGYIIREEDYQDAENAGSDRITMRQSVTQDEYVPFVTVNVTDSAAHAWVEVYISGYGWFPVEVTFGGTGHLADRAKMVGEISLPAPSDKPTPTPTPTPKLPSVLTPTPMAGTPTVTPKITSSITPAVSPTPKLSHGISPTPGGNGPSGPGGGKNAGEKTGSGALLVILRVMLVLAGVVSLAFIRRSYARTKRRHRMFGTTPRHAIAAICCDIGQLFRLNGVAHNGTETERAYCMRAAEKLGFREELAWLYETGNRAAFSGDTITKSDRKRAIMLYRRLRSRTLKKQSAATRLAWIFLRGI